MNRSIEDIMKRLAESNVSSVGIDNVIYARDSSVGNLHYNPADVVYVSPSAEYDDTVRRLQRDYDDAQKRLPKENTIREERLMLRGQLEQNEKDGKLQPGEAKRIIESVSNEKIKEILAKL